MTAPQESGPWPHPDAPGRYQAKCSCGLERTGTARELAHFRRLHSDSPAGSHVVTIMHGGRRTDQPEVTG